MKKILLKIMIVTLLTLVTLPTIAVSASSSDIWHSDEIAATAKASKAKPKVTLNRKKLTLVVGKASSKLKIKKRLAGDKVTSWKSSNKKIAIVNRKTGKVRAKKAGTTYVTVRMKSGASARCKVIVTKPTVKKETPVVTSYVWLSATGTKYHKINNCGTMNPTRATRVTLAHAQSRGFGACSKCF